MLPRKECDLLLRFTEFDAFIMTVSAVYVSVSSPWAGVEGASTFSLKSLCLGRGRMRVPPGAFWFCDFSAPAAVKYVPVVVFNQVYGVP